MPTPSPAPKFRFKPGQLRAAADEYRILIALLNVGEMEVSDFAPINRRLIEKFTKEGFYRIKEKAWKGLYHAD